MSDDNYYCKKCGEYLDVSYSVCLFCGKHLCVTCSCPCQEKSIDEAFGY